MNPTDSPGKTSDATDVVDVEFTELVPPERVVQRAVFEADDPSYAGTMTMTWHLTTGEGTKVTVIATDVPPGIDQAIHEAGMASSLANLTSQLERGRLSQVGLRPMGRPSLSSISRTENSTKHQVSRSASRVYSHEVPDVSVPRHEQQVI
ncbi:SRPBCC domain-containing protein [Nonomuraea sp. NPDC004702]